MKRSKVSNQFSSILVFLALCISVLLLLSALVLPTQVNAQQDPSEPVPVESTNFPISGYLVAIRVLDSKDKPIIGATVEMKGDIVLTDSSGVASFIDVSAGTHDVTIKSSVGSKTDTITIADNAPKDTVQEFNFSIKNKNQWMLIGTSILLILVVLLGAKYFPKGKRTRHKSASHKQTETKHKAGQ